MENSNVLRTRLFSIQSAMHVNMGESTGNHETDLCIFILPLYLKQMFEMEMGYLWERFAKHMFS